MTDAEMIAHLNKQGYTVVRVAELGSEQKRRLSSDGSFTIIQRTVYYGQWEEENSLNELVVVGCTAERSGTGVQIISAGGVTLEIDMGPAGDVAAHRLSDN